MLYGFEYHDHRRISTAVKQELIRLISEKGLPKTKGGEIKDYYYYQMPYRVDAGSFNISPKMNNPKTIGSEIARLIYNSLR